MRVDEFSRNRHACRIAEARGSPRRSPSARTPCVPPPPGIRPTPVSTSPMYSSACACRRAPWSEISVPPPKHSAIRRNHHRPRAELDRLGHALEGADRQVHILPLALLCGQQKLHQIRADGEVVRIARDHERAEITHRIGCGIERLRDQPHDVVADRALLRVQLDACHAVAQVDQRSARVAANYAVAGAEVCNAREPVARATGW